MGRLRSTRSHSGRTVQSGPQSGVALLQHSTVQVQVPAGGSCWFGAFFWRVRQVKVLGSMYLGFGVGALKDNLHY